MGRPQLPLGERRRNIKDEPFRPVSCVVRFSEEGEEVGEMIGEIPSLLNTIDLEGGTGHRDLTIFPLCPGQEYNWFSACL